MRSGSQHGINPFVRVAHPAASAETLNSDCHSAIVDRGALEQTLRGQGEDFLRAVMDEHPHLFAGVPLFVSGAQVEQMSAVIAAVEGVVKLDGWECDAPLPNPDGTTSHSTKPASGQVAGYLPPAGEGTIVACPALENCLGVFFGYDFHLNAEGAHLIEINANAGGALLNALLLQSQRDVAMPGEVAALDNLEQVFLDMFRNEWRIERGDAPLQAIAIVDEQPEQQYLYPEFLLAQRMFERAGITALIADPSELESRADGLYCREHKVNLIYNRLTDFFLQRHAALNAAYQGNQVVLTPHPRAYAQYADKRNLARLTDAEGLRALGVNEADIAVLQAGIPHTIVVQPDMEAALWAERKQWFFKPATGYGSKGAYRGANLTRRVFDEIMQGGYVAQRIALPGERMVCIESAEPASLKSDVRCYIYNGQVQLIAARLYQGQTTNFRTEGGGFAPVRIVG